MDNEILRDRLYQLNIHKSVGPDWIHLRLLKKLADVMAGLHLIIYQRSWELGRSMLTVRGPVIPIYKKGVREDPANYRPVSSWKKYGKDHTLGAIDQHLKNNAVTRHSQHGFTKGSSSSVNCITFYDKVTHLVDVF